MACARAHTHTHVHTHTHTHTSLQNLVSPQVIRIFYKYWFSRRSKPQESKHILYNFKMFPGFSVHTDHTHTHTHTSQTGAEWQDGYWVASSQELSLWLAVVMQAIETAYKKILSTFQTEWAISQTEVSKTVENLRELLPREESKARIVYQPFDVCEKHHSMFTMAEKSPVCFLLSRNWPCWDGVGV